MSTYTRKLKLLQQSIHDALEARDSTRVAASWRDILRLFFAESDKREDPEPETNEREYARLFEAAKQAIVFLGGQGDFSISTVANYDHELYGPFLGVSDNGSATKAIRTGAIASPKCAVLGGKSLDPLKIGAAHDAERLGAVGEVVVGPDEYSTIRLACHDRLLTTTNVGTRVNFRNFLPPPLVVLGGASRQLVIDKAIADFKSQFARFASSETSKGRKVTVFVQFRSGTSPQVQLQVLRELVKQANSGQLSKSRKHHVGWLCTLRSRTVAEFRKIAGIANQAGIKAIALDGPPRKAARNAVSLPGLLNFFTPADLARVLRIAAQHGVQVTPISRVDPQTTARHIWTGLSVARSMGIDLGKYGMVPLTMNEQKEIIARIQFWFPHWCPAPVFYIDEPLLTDDDVYYEPNLKTGIRLWLEMVAKQKVKVVLIDTANKSEGRKLLKNNASDKVGFLTLEQVAELTKLGESKRIKILWAGGISGSQAYELGKLGVFGMYVTSDAADAVPLDKRSRRDPLLVHARRPEAKKVARVKLLIEAGFLAGRGARDIEPLACRLLEATKDNEKSRAQADLFDAVKRAWKKHFELSQKRIVRR